MFSRPAAFLQHPFECFSSWTRGLQAKAKDGDVTPGSGCLCDLGNHWDVRRPDNWQLLQRSREVCLCENLVMELFFAAFLTFFTLLSSYSFNLWLIIGQRGRSQNSFFLKSLRKRRLVYLQSKHESTTTRESRSTNVWNEVSSIEYNKHVFNVCW